MTFLGIIFGCSLMRPATCDLTRRPLGRLATASSSEGNASRHGERALVVSVFRQEFDGTRPIADI